MTPASQVIFSKGHQVLESIGKKEKQKIPVFVSFISIAAVMANYSKKVFDKQPELKCQDNPILMKK